MAELDDYEAAKALLYEAPATSCATTEAVGRCPEPVQRALKEAMFDLDVSAPRIIKLLAQYNANPPSETAVRRHRTGGCRCPRES